MYISGIELSYIFPKKVFPIFWEMELLSLSLKNFPEKSSYIFLGKIHSKKPSHILSKKEFSYILGNRTF